MSEGRAPGDEEEQAGDLLAVRVWGGAAMKTEKQPTCAKCGKPTALGPVRLHCDCTWAGKVELDKQLLSEGGKETIERFEARHKPIARRNRWHWNNGRLDRRNVPMAACGERQYRNLNPDPTMVNCEYCFSLMKLFRPDAYMEAFRRQTGAGGSA